MNIHKQIFTNKHRYLFGIPVQSSFGTVAVLSQLLDSHRQAVNWVCEIGTGSGGVTLFLAVWARLRGIPCMSFDVKDVCDLPELPIKSTLKLLGADLHKEDVFDEVVQEYIEDSLDGQSTGLLICDGGDKRRELQTFGPRTAKGSLIVVHDFGFEILPRDVEAVDEVEYYEQWHSQSIALRTKLAVLRRR